MMLVLVVCLVCCVMGCKENCYSCRVYGLYADDFHAGSRKVGQCVSVDMLKSPTPGLVAQMVGWIDKSFVFILSLIGR